MPHPSNFPTTNQGAPSPGILEKKGQAGDRCSHLGLKSRPLKELLCILLPALSPESLLQPQGSQPRANATLTLPNTASQAQGTPESFSLEVRPQGAMSPYPCPRCTLRSSASQGRMLPGLPAVQKASCSPGQRRRRAGPNKTGARQRSGAAEPGPLG